MNGWKEMQFFVDFGTNSYLQGVVLTPFVMINLLHLYFHILYWLENFLCHLLHMLQKEVMPHMNSLMVYQKSSYERLKHLNYWTKKGPRSLEDVHLKTYSTTYPYQIFVIGCYVQVIFCGFSNTWRIDDVELPRWLVLIISICYQSLYISLK